MHDGIDYKVWYKPNQLSDIQLFKNVARARKLSSLINNDLSLIISLSESLCAVGKWKED